MLIFFDTEFTDLSADAKLISIGLVREDGTSYYAELTDTYELEDCSEFVLEHVLPQLDGGDARITLKELSDILRGWLRGSGQPVTLVTDSPSWDWHLLQSIFDGDMPTNINNTPFDANLLFCSSCSEPVQNIHHALKDAGALYQTWLATQSKRILVTSDFCICHERSSISHNFRRY